MKILKELKKLHENTAKEWTWNSGLSLCVYWTHPTYPGVSKKEIAQFELTDDGRNAANFIVEAHKMVPRLIAALEKCMEQRDILISDYGLRYNLPIIDIKENVDKELEQILKGE